MAYNFSKSKFVAGCKRCDKYVWLDKYKPEAKTPPSEFSQVLIDNGHLVGDLAKKFFNVQVDVSASEPNGVPNLKQRQQATKQHMDNGVGVIAEASFSYNGYFCSVDILVKNGDAYDVYEVKSSKKQTVRRYNGVKESYLQDAAYQQYVLQGCGVNVGTVNVVLLANDYVCDGTLQLDKYFTIVDVTSYTNEFQDFVINKLDSWSSVLQSPDEPCQPFFKNCQECEFFAYCSQKVTKPSPFDVYGMNFSDKCDMYNQGLSFEEAASKAKKYRDITKLQATCYNRPNDMHVDKQQIRQFLDKLSFPAYSLDFETFQATVPQWKGVETSQQLPFQYSVHVIKGLDTNGQLICDNLEERNFLDVSGNDPRQAMAEQLVKDIPYGACVLAYNKNTEKGIVDKLAAQFDHLAKHLRSFDYYDPSEVFKNGWCYNSAMGGSFSIKSVLPALYPNDASLDYHNLSGSIKNGKDAMTAIQKAKDATPQELEQIRKDLTNYCALDTYAVVKVLKKLYQLVQ